MIIADIIGVILMIGFAAARVLIKMRGTRNLDHTAMGILSSKGVMSF
jgi:hypothetical protein